MDEPQAEDLPDDDLDEGYDDYDSENENEDEDDPWSAAPGELVPAARRRARSRMVRAQQVGRDPAPHLRSARQRDPAVLAPPRRTALGTLRAASALALRLPPRAERVRPVSLAPGLRRRPRPRLREWVAASGTRLDRDRPTRQTTWHGEEPADPIEDVFVADRDRDFVDYVAAQVAERRAAEDAFYAGADPVTGEVTG